jgi:16S rRNA processing protein RimM
VSAVLAEKSRDDAWVAIARVLRPRGRRGEVVAEVLTDFPERFATTKRAFLENPETVPQPVEIAETWWHEGRLILRFAGVDSITQAERLRGRLLMIPQQERVALGENQYYVWQLIGCAVFCRGSRQPLGEVTGIEPTGGVELLKVRRSGFEAARSGDLLIPFAHEICPEIDVGARRIVIDPPEGLLDLNEERPHAAPES